MGSFAVGRRRDDGGLLLLGKLARLMPTTWQPDFPDNLGTLTVLPANVPPSPKASIWEAFETHLAARGIEGRAGDGKGVEGKQSRCGRGNPPLKTYRRDAMRTARIQRRE